MTKQVLNKIILEVNDNGNISYKHYESVLKIFKDPLYNNVPYDNWRALLLGGRKQKLTSKPIKYRDGNAQLCLKFKVYDNPDYLNRFIIKTDEKQPVTVV